MRVVALSDTHGRHGAVAVPDGDLLIHAGDFTDHGSLEEIAAFDAFLAGLPHRHKVVIAGNHDFAFERDPAAARAVLAHATYLEDGETTVDGLRLWGSPWQPWFYDWAFNLRRGADIRRKWALIPEGIDILVTHGPPHGHGDRTAQGLAVGCEDLLTRVREVRPRVHLFGHIHEGFGTTSDGTTTFVNASTCDLRYRPVNPPLVLDL